MRINKLRKKRRTIKHRERFGMNTLRDNTVNGSGKKRNSLHDGVNYSTQNEDFNVSSSLPIK